MPFKSAGIILLDTDNGILLGHSSQWLVSNKKYSAAAECKVGPIYDYQREHRKTVDLHESYAEKCMILEGAIRLPVRYSHPIKKKIYHTTKFQIPSPEGQYSIPKGHREGREQTMTTALREFHEETGITGAELDSYANKLSTDIVVNDTKFLVYQIKNDLTKAEIDRIIDRTNRSYLGELFFLEFYQLSELPKLNYVSRSALRILQSSLRTTRK